MELSLCYLISMYVVVMSYMQLKKNVQEILLDITSIIMIPISLLINLWRILKPSIARTWKKSS